MGKSVMAAVVSMDGFIAADDDEVGPLFEWYGNGNVRWSFPATIESFGPPSRQPTSCKPFTVTWP
ncbi:MAG: hypothetical protein M5T61_16360 [Acidimicrobiia bacterium]|nr:hypothetical protein [Acidimicrobiia bacterium]